MRAFALGDRHEQHPQAMDGVGCPAHLFLFGIAVGRGRDLPCRAAHAREGADPERGGHLYARRHRTGPPGVAVDGRNAAWIHLGSWRLRGAGLERRLAASGGHRSPEHLGNAGRWQCHVRAALRRAEGRPARPPAGNDACQHLRPVDEEHHPDRRPCGCIVDCRCALHQSVRQRSRDLPQSFAKLMR